MTVLASVDAALDAPLEHWILEQVRAGTSPEAVLRPLIEQGWAEQAAIDAVEAAMRRFVEQREREDGLPPSSRVPAPLGLNDASILHALDRDVRVVAQLRHPRVIAFSNVLSDEECDALVEMSRARLSRSATVNMETGGDEVHVGRTSQGTCHARGGNALLRRIESRLAALLDWPLEKGEGMQVLRYGVGAEYKPHHDYFDPSQPGASVLLARGGQRVASMVMYLNTPERGGATTFPEAGFEVAAVKGNAVFFSYDRPHPMTLSLHGGAPVLAGEKWVATKWLREHVHA